MSLTKNLTNAEKLELLKELYHDIAGLGRGGDTMLAHINAEEAALLKAHGGAGTINPATGLPEYKSAFKAISSAVSAISSFSGFGSPWMTAASLAFQGYSMLKQRSQQKKAAAASRAQAEVYKRAEESKQRYSDVQAQRARIQAQREARIRHGQILASMGTSGLGMTGTAPFTGAMGSVSSQLGTNIGDINVGQSFAQEQTGYNIAAANYGQKQLEAESRAAGWKQMGTMAENIPTVFGNIFDIGSSTTSSSTSNRKFTSPWT